MIFKQTHSDVSKGFKRTPVVKRDAVDVDKTAPLYADGGNLRSIMYVYIDYNNNTLLPSSLLIIVANIYIYIYI